MLGPQKGLAYNFLCGVFQLDSGAWSCTRTRNWETEPATRECTERSVAADAGSGGEPGGEAKSDGADRDYNGCAKCSRQKRGARRPVAAGESLRYRHRRTAQPSSISWRANTRI